jgi:hypothetical protein
MGPGSDDEANALHNRQRDAITRGPERRAELGRNRPGAPRREVSVCLSRYLERARRLRAGPMPIQSTAHLWSKGSSAPPSSRASCSRRGRLLAQSTRRPSPPSATIAVRPRSHRRPPSKLPMRPSAEPGLRHATETGRFRARCSRRATTASPPPRCRWSRANRSDPRRSSRYRVIPSISWSAPSRDLAGCEGASIGRLAPDARARRERDRPPGSALARTRAAPHCLIGRGIAPYSSLRTRGSPRYAQRR